LIAPARSQTLDLALVEANITYAGQITFRLDRKDRLIVDHFHEGKRTRQDRMLVADIDPDSTLFSPETNAIRLKCREDRIRCIDKEVFKYALIKHSGSDALPIPPNDASGEKGTRVVKQLLELAEQGRHAEQDVTRMEDVRKK
jgi:hypothetical protein